MAPHTHMMHQPYSILVNGEVSFGHPNPRQPLLACSSAYCGALAPWGLIRLRGALVHMVETGYTNSDSTRIHPNYEASTMSSAN